MQRLSQIKAQVKLRFNNVKKQQVIVTRSLNVTQKAATRSQKTLDTVLTIKDPETGELRSITSRCSSIDDELVAHLGVSKAILDNVIFCHQEDSFWPLAESSTLKKKFDEIFASTKYTKAMAEIKDIKKETSASIKEFAAELVHLRTLKDKANRVADDLEKTRLQISQLDDRIEELDGGIIDKVVHDMSTLMEQQQRLSLLVSKRSEYISKHQMLTERIHEISSSVEIYNEPDDELQQLLEKYLSSLTFQKDEQDALEANKSRLSEQHETMARNISECYTRRGQLVAENEAHIRHKESLKALASELIQEHGYTAFDATPLSPDDARRFVRTLEQDFNDKNKAIDRHRSEYKGKENAILNQIQSIQSNHHITQETKKSYNSQIDASNRRIQALKYQIGVIEAAQHELDTTHYTLATEEASLKAAQQAVESKTITNQIAALTSKMIQLDRSIESKGHEIIIASTQSNTRTRISLKKAELAKKQDLQQVLQHSVSSHLSGGLIKSDSVVNEAIQSLSVKEKELKTVQEQLASKSLDLASVEAKLAILTSSHKEKTKELEELRQSITNECGQENYLDALEKAQNTTVTFKENAAEFQTTISIFSRYVRRFENKKVCPLCTRCFDSAAMEREFLSRLKSTIDRAPLAAKETQEGLKTAKEHQDRLTILQPSWDSCERLASIEIPALLKQVQEMTGEHKQLQKSVSLLEMKATKLSESVKALDTQKEKLTELARVTEDVTTLQRELQTLNSELGHASSDLTVDELQRQLSDIQHEERTVRRDVERLNLEAANQQRELHACENRVRDTKQKIEKLESAFKDRDKAVEEINNLNVEIERLNGEITRLDLKMANLNESLNSMNAELDETRREGAEIESELMKGTNALQHAIMRISSFESEIDRFIKSGGEQMLNACDVETKRLESNAQKLKEQIIQLTEGIDNLQVQKSEVQVLQRTIEDNMKLRRLKRDLEVTEQETNECEQGVLEMDVHSMEQQYQQLKERHEELMGERAQLVGEQKQLEENARRFEKELRTEYARTTELFQERTVEHQLAKKTVDDLDVYTKALDKAILTHHQQKMDEINKIIRELWTKTYKGLDIDTIEIRWNMEKETAARTYNYRVVMVKGDVELDMRGRCSAGQKVLTSIIIRLALAETFCGHCGILALDEPTTNLDRDNMESLAVALSDIIALRRQESTFQLILITHDEDFMRKLGSHEFTDSYYRVERQADGVAGIRKEFFN